MKLKFVFIWLFLQIFFFPNICRAQSQPVPDIEYQALVDFYDAMNGNNWPVSYRWDVNKNDLLKEYGMESALLTDTSPG